MWVLKAVAVLVFLAVRAVLWVLFVPLGRLVLGVSKRLGILRLPFLLVFSPIVLMCLLLDGGPGNGRQLDGDIICPTFTIPFAFARGPWRVLEEQNSREAKLELVDGDERSTLVIRASTTLEELRKGDQMAAGIIDKALMEPPLPNGMRWAGARLHTFLGADAPLTCVYFVWKDDEPETACITVTFQGLPEHEAAADAFISSAMPELPEVEEEAEQAAA